MTDLEPAMSPEVHERIAVAESKLERTEATVAQILDLVQRMPARMTKRMRRLLRECRESQAQTYGQPLKKPEPDRDWTQVIRAVVVGAGIVGGLLAGAYQGLSANEPRPPIVAPK